MPLEIYETPLDWRVNVFTRVCPVRWQFTYPRHPFSAKEAHSIPVDDITWSNHVNFIFIDTQVQLEILHDAHIISGDHSFHFFFYFFHQIGIMYGLFFCVLWIYRTTWFIRVYCYNNYPLTFVWYRLTYQQSNCMYPHFAEENRNHE